MRRVILANFVMTVSCPVGKNVTFFTLSIRIITTLPTDH
jgi:hypothetical protein